MKFCSSILSTRLLYISAIWASFISPFSLKQNFLSPTKEKSYLHERQSDGEFIEQSEHSSLVHSFDNSCDIWKLNVTNLFSIERCLKFRLVLDSKSSKFKIYWKVKFPVWFNEYFILKVEKSNASYNDIFELLFGLSMKISSGILEKIIDLNLYPMRLFL